MITLHSMNQLIFNYILIHVKGRCQYFHHLDDDDDDDMDDDDMHMSFV